MESTVETNNGFTVETAMDKLRERLAEKIQARNEASAGVAESAAAKNDLERMRLEVESIENNLRVVDSKLIDAMSGDGKDTASLKEAKDQLVNQKKTFRKRMILAGVVNARKQALEKASRELMTATIPVGEAVADEVALQAADLIGKLCGLLEEWDRYREQVLHATGYRPGRNLPFHHTETQWKDWVKRAELLEDFVPMARSAGRRKNDSEIRKGAWDDPRRLAPAGFYRTATPVGGAL